MKIALSKNILKSAPIYNIGTINNLKFNEDNNINRIINFTNNGYSNLVKLIIEILLK